MFKNSLSRTASAALLLALTIGVSGCNQSTSTTTSNGGGSRNKLPKSNPTLETDPALLDAAWACNEFQDPAAPKPVLLVHGTLTHGEEQWTWNYEPLLTERGFDVCIVSYPDRGLGDMQVAAEYLVHAIRSVHALSGRPVSIIGHSQGGMNPRWAVRWWSDVRELVDDLILIAAPNFGITDFDSGLQMLDFPGAPTESQQPASIHQMTIGSNYLAALNSIDQTPGDISYTNLYTEYDEVVQPVTPIPTAALEYYDSGKPRVDPTKPHKSLNPNVSNILLQEFCPGRLVEHAMIGLLDSVTFELAVDALNHPGPAMVERAGGPETLCPLPLLPLPAFTPTMLIGLLDTLASEAGASFPELHLSEQEPPLKPYAR